ncbi:MAG: bifunctional phosphoribosylaminoimidazolecarboxamide formyltransferase/IMP cyclohydrolase [Oscillospiraceae bacterium]
MKKLALLSVYDKSGIEEFARFLADAGYGIISTGGTARALEMAGIEHVEVSELTGFPECLDGRVKTLHPAVHAGILAMRENEQHMAKLAELQIDVIDIVAVNLYPFKATIEKPKVSFEEAVENIDIGGPTLLRAAAKNHHDVAVICDPRDYVRIEDEIDSLGSVSTGTKRSLATKAFCHTAAYDALIARYFLEKEGGSLLDGDSLTLTYEKMCDVRYGENPHQRAALYRETAAAKANSVCSAQQLWGKELSFNNINDANGALDVLKEFSADVPCAVGVKHANPCGVGTAKTLLEAYRRAYEADPVSIFGGVVAVNREIDAETAAELSKTFLEIVIAPSFSCDALKILKEKKNLRLLKLKDCALPNTPDMLDMKKIAGGLLVQQQDTQLFDEEELTVVTKRAPTQQELEMLKFAFGIVKHTKSNAIVLAKENMTVGIGPGQTNRITAFELAIEYAKDKAVGSVAASDAFFPFDDCVKAASRAGVTAIIQPGGSVRDEDSIKAANDANIAMVFTHMRHFKH